jgi:hypothetical protein
MKVNRKALELIDKGLSANTVKKLTESQINVLHSKLVVEQVTQQTTTTYNIPTSELEKGAAVPSPPAGKKMVIQKTSTGIKATPMEEMTEDETDDVNDKNALGADALQSLTGQEAPHDANDMAPDGMDDDSDDNRNMMGMSEEKNKSNPWAICHSQVGPKRTRKFERCVKSVKKQLEEGKNPVSLFIESQIMKIVEKHLPPRITKGDLLRHLSETSHNKMMKDTVEAAEPTIAPSKPITKPDTKPRTRPSHPGKNPFPGEKEAPRAGKVSPDEAKDKVIDVILNLLKK